jgi:hypothetical protein
MVLRHSPRLALAGAAAALLTVAACGSSSSTPASTPSLNPQAAALAFAQCMRAHGVNVPDPQINTGGGNGGSGGAEVRIDAGTSKTQAGTAMQACQKYLPQIGGNGSGTLDPARQAQILKFAQCMRSHGITDFPDPGSNGHVLLGGNSGPPPADLNPSNPTFESAQNACQQLLPGKGAGLNTVQGGGSGPGVVSGGGGG